MGIKYISENDIRISHSRDVYEDLSPGTLVFFNQEVVDSRAFHPFGPDFDYSKEPEIVVDRLFATPWFLEHDDQDNEGAVRINDWLAIFNHYGFEANYAEPFLRIFGDRVSSALLQVYREDNTIHSTKTSRLFHGKQYTRGDFIEEYLDFWDRRGYICP